MEKIIYINEKNEKIEFSKYGPFVLSIVDGLGGVSNNIVTSKSPNQNGISIHNSTLNERNISITGGIIGKGSHQMYKLRQELVRIFNPALSGTLIYENDYITRKIDVQVVDGPTWRVKTGRIQEFLIQIVAPFPYFHSNDEVKTTLSEWIGTFQFPLDISESKGVIMGYREFNQVINIENKGDINCGITVKLTAEGGSVENPEVFNIDTREYIKINRKLEIGDSLIIKTQHGSKRVELTRSNNEVINAFHYVDLDSSFFTLSPGDNLIRYGADKGLENLEVSIYHRELYLGV